MGEVGARQIGCDERQHQSLPGAYSQHHREHRVKDGANAEGCQQPLFAAQRLASSESGPEWTTYEHHRTRPQQRPVQEVDEHVVAIELEQRIEVEQVVNQEHESGGEQERAETASAQQ